MGDLCLNLREQVQLAYLLTDRARPKGVRPGTWHQLRHGELWVIETAELLALMRAYPAVAAAVGLIAALPEGEAPQRGRGRVPAS